MSETKRLQVMYDEKLVGTLPMASGHKVAFQYSEEWGQLPITLSGHWNKQMEIQTWMNWQNNVRKFSIQNIQIN